MHDTDRQLLEGMLANIIDRDRISVASARSAGFTLMHPTIRPIARADFQVSGMRRRRFGDAREELPYRFNVTKTLVVEKRRVVVQVEDGRILTLAYPTGAWMPLPDELF